MKKGSHAFRAKQGQLCRLAKAEAKAKREEVKSLDRLWPWELDPSLLPKLPPGK